MTIEEAIKMLEQYENKKDEIIINWWDREAFMDDKEFEIALENEDNVDWGDIHDQLIDYGYEPIPYPKIGE
jgi:hypothetical protein|tara:strand:+ start:183 stop:395 length:213 start_codon:yes stop_codon:yes gene_type:complete